MSASNITDPSLLTPDLITLVSSIYRLSGALWIVPLCLIFYDMLLTYDEEIRHFWTKPDGVGLTHWLFFLNRYWPAFNLVFHNTVLSLRHPTPTFCVIWFQYTGYSAGAQHLIVGGILIIRIYAIFGCNKRLLIVLLSLYALWIGSETVLIGLVTSRFHSNEALRDIFPGCAPTNIPLWSFVYWIPSLTFESLLLILASWKTVQEASSTIKSSSLMAVLLRDSVLYFGGVTLFTVANFLAWYIAPLPLYGMFVGCHIGFQSIIGCRMLLNIRETAAAQIEAQSGASISTVKFNTKIASNSKGRRFSATSDDFTRSMISEADTLV